MIETDREDQRNDEQQYQYVLVSSADHQQAEKAENQDHHLRYDHIRQDRAYEKAVLALKKRQASGAMMADVKRAFYD
jgi:hypothetical protein